MLWDASRAFWKQPPSLQGRLASQDDKKTAVFAREFVGQKPTDARPTTPPHLTRLFGRVPHIPVSDTLYMGVVSPSQLGQRDKSLTAYMSYPF